MYVHKKNVHNTCIHDSLPLGTTFVPSKRQVGQYPLAYVTMEQWSLSRISWSSRPVVATRGKKSILDYSQGSLYSWSSTLSLQPVLLPTASQLFYTLFFHLELALLQYFLFHPSCWLISLHLSLFKKTETLKRTSDWSQHQFPNLPACVGAVPSVFSPSTLHEPLGPWPALPLAFRILILQSR